MQFLSQIFFFFFPKRKKNDITMSCDFFRQNAWILNELNDHNWSPEVDIYEQTQHPGHAIHNNRMDLWRDEKYDLVMNLILDRIQTGRNKLLQHHMDGSCSYLRFYKVYCKSLVLVTSPFLLSCFIFKYFTCKIGHQFFFHSF